MIPVHDVIGAADAKKLVFFAHGILGSRNNWKSFAKRLIELRPAWRAVILDLRNHGESHGAQPPHTIEACARDVLELEGVIGLPDVVVGHSYGGKVMLQVASMRPAKLKEAWILDAPPGLRTFQEGREELDRVLAAVRAVPMPVPTRKALVDDLRARGMPEAICQWMTTNLRAADDGNGFVWRFRLDVIPEMLEAFGARDLWPFIEGHSEPPRVVLVRGGRSDRWSDDEKARLVRAVARGTITDHVLKDAGHWLHTDDPEGLMNLLAPALERLEQRIEQGP